jgi:acyl carrier protein
VSRDELRAAIFAALAEVAPEADPRALRDEVPLRDQLDLDSMDFLNLLIGVHQRTGVEIPEADYGELESLGQLVAYLEARQPIRGE